jgi:hypothetical protein
MNGVSKRRPSRRAMISLQASTELFTTAVSFSFHPLGAEIIRANQAITALDRLTQKSIR